ncbi:dethiobiotin synthase [Gammaproteobacteria bacterium 45_16_T64]|nr:dethiobiotin synthase [Gammaproteobacteria bacterium 45_16_T64]
MRKKKYFVTGTCTDVGKTFVSVALLSALKKFGASTLALKPIAAGCEDTPEGLRNDDAMQLREAMTATLSYEQVNPVALAQAAAPHLVAASEGRRVTVSRLEGICRGALMNPVDVALIEGAGGWRVPLNERETLADLAVVLDFPVILVVGMRLGCINHALLTQEAIRRDGLTIAGWVANHVEADMDFADENVASLVARLDAPLIGRIPFVEGQSPQSCADHLDISMLL